MPELLLTHRAKEDLGSLPRPMRDAVIETLALIEVEPETADYFVTNVQVTEAG